MTRRLATTTLLLLLALGTVPDQATAATGPTVDQLVQGIQAYYKSKTDITVDFHQVIVKPATGRKLKARGTIYYKHPNRFYWYQLRPDKLHYVSDGTVFWKYQPDQNSAEKFLLKSTQLLYTIRLFFGQGDLKKGHKLSVGRRESDGAATLTLVPIDQRVYKKLTLIVDPKSFAIRETMLVDPDDNTNRIRYQRVRFDPIPASRFRFSPESGVNVRDFTKPRRETPKKS
ncbi:MAG: outer membrane lipoprotein carrier protein LolA [Verrucomicrobiae bacterium]|nr:outer membrane lipoprotein carrier protein LolA [Verrucomicrobiae bacterium]